MLKEGEKKMEKVKFEHQSEFVFLVPKEVFKSEKKEEKSKQKQQKANPRNYAKYHEQQLDLKKLKAKLDANSMGNYNLRMY